MLPLISIIIPVYNVEKYLRECLDSVVNQILSEIEIICVNDCSTDNSLSILNEYTEKDPRIKIIDKPKNSGLPATRNVGIDNASGKYVMFVDSDDLVAADLCRKAYDCAETMQADMVIYDSIPFYDKSPDQNIILNSLSVLRSLNSEDRLSLLHLKSFACTKLIKLDVIKKYNIRFPEGLIYEDIPVHWELVTQVKRISLLPEKLYYYRQRQGSICYTADWSQADSFVIYDMLREFLTKNNLIHLYGDYLLERELNNFAYLYDTLYSNYKKRVIDEINIRLNKAHLEYIYSKKPLLKRTRDFFLSLQGSLMAKVRRFFWLTARSGYRFVKKPLLIRMV